MRTEQGIGVDVGLFQNGIIHDEHGEIVRFEYVLGPSNERFGVGPDLARIQGHAAQPARHLVVANLPIEEPREAGAEVWPVELMR